MAEGTCTRYRSRLIATLLVLVAFASPSAAETVTVKYRGPVDLAPFSCELTQSSVVHRLCYDAREQYVVVNLSGTYYHYCEVPPRTVAAWRSADSLGRFFNANIKGRFDCRVNRMPSYR